MTEIELQQFLQINFPKENDACDWKEMKNLKNSFASQEGDDVISYVSAIANMKGGYLIIGVKDKTLEIVGTDLSRLTFNGSQATPESAAFKLTEHCTNLSSEGLKIEEFVTEDTNKTVWIIHIPKHMPRRPVYAHKKAWQRVKDSLIQMRPERIDFILAEPIAGNDWTATIIPDATLEDLDPEAIRVARREYIAVHPNHTEEEVNGWDDVTFLNKAKLTIKGQITMAAIIIVGREESEHYLLPHVCKIRWALKDMNGENIDFGIFSIPMILAVDEIAKTIRNTTYEFSINGNIFPEKLKRYDMFTLREPLNNAIAHQNYEKCCRIEVIEHENDHLVFINHASFIPESVESVVMQNSPESYYRNPFLVEAMRNVHMVDTEGGGIKKLYEQQRKRFFPMPDYDLSDGKVKVTIDGKVIDERFANILTSVHGLSIYDIILLDKVQKQRRLTDEEIKYLRNKGLVEGRKTNLFLSRSIAKSTGNVGLKSTYVRNKSFDDEYFRNLIIQYLEKFGKASRRELEELVIPKLSEVLTDAQKKNKVKNLLYAMRTSGKIEQGEHRLWKQSSNGSV